MKTSPTKFRMLGLAIAAIMANVGFSMMHDPEFSVRQALMLVALCLVTTFVVHEAVTAVEMAVARKAKKKV